MSNNDLYAALRELFKRYTLWQILSALANIIDDMTQHSPSYDYRQLGRMLRQAHDRMAEFCGRGD